MCYSADSHWLFDEQGLTTQSFREVHMTNIRRQAVVSVIIVGLSAAAAAGTPPDPHAVLIQYGVGTRWN